MSENQLYPSIDPFETGMLPVGEGHEIYWERCGNPEGQPILFLHGGPGSGCTPSHRCYFDPDHYQIILLDQRGCGRSIPHGETDNNTTELLIRDLEALREMFRIEQWMLFGGSWGSTLALAYAQAHPAAVKALILRGIFLGTASECDWFLHKMGSFFPEAFADFAETFRASGEADLLSYYHRRLMNPDPEIHMPAAHQWSRFEARCATLLPSAETLSYKEDPAVALAISRMEAHYFQNRMFLEEGQLLDQLDRISHIPGIIVQGRYDVICPPQTAYRLHQAWDHSQLVMVDDAGHSASESGLIRELVGATDRLRCL